MPGYENAPATRMLAVYCAACSRPLLDAKSVEIGLGPECRKRHGYRDLLALSDVSRARANLLVHEIAVAQTGLRVLEAVGELRALGLPTLADRIAERCAEIVVSVDGGAYRVKAPYSEEAAAAWRCVPGRRWDRDAKVNTVPLERRAELWSLLQAHYAGLCGIGPRGPFQVGAPVAADERRAA